MESFWFYITSKSSKGSLPIEFNKNERPTKKKNWNEIEIFATALLYTVAYTKMNPQSTLLYITPVH